MASNVQAENSEHWQNAAFLTVKRCAHVLGVSAAAVYKLRKEGVLEFRRVAGRSQVTVDSVVALVESAEPWEAAQRGGRDRGTQQPKESEVWG